MSWPENGLEFFTRSEFNRPDDLDEAALLFVDEVRRRSGVRIKINSDFRTQEEHFTIYPDPAKRPNSPHQRGTAFDFAPVSFTVKNRMRVLWAILDIWHEDEKSPHPKYQKIGLEIATRHFHTDFDDELIRPHMWLGKSK